MSDDQDRDYGIYEDEDGNRCVRIKEFDLNSMCENPSIVMIAKRGSGKSWVCRAILNMPKNHFL